MIKRITLWFSAALILLSSSGVLYESWANTAARRNYPPPGRLVDAGGYRLHIHAQGDKPPGAPTIILEHGGASMSAQWGWIQPALARHTQVVIYDRPGLGWSEPAPTQLDAETAMHDLYAALQTAGIEGPYLLAGHSMGGLLVQVFARLYPEDTAGLVLIDPVTVEPHELLPYGMNPLMLTLFQSLARLGVVRLAGIAAQQAAGLPDPWFEQAVAFFPAHTQLRAWSQEGALGESSLAFLRRPENQAHTLPVPMLLLAAEVDGEGFDHEQRAALHTLYQRQVEAWEHAHLHVIPDAGHASIVVQAQPAHQVTNAIVEMLNMLNN